MKKLKQTNGITLIALIVTIIVLLILAVVSFRVITGDDGILSKATTSTEKSRIAAAEELLNLKKAQIIANAYEEGLKKPDLKYIYDALVDSSDFEVQKVVYKAEAKIKSGIPTDYDFGKVDYILVISDEYKDVTLKIDNDLQTVTRSIGKKRVEPDKEAPVITIGETTSNSITFTISDDSGVVAYGLTTSNSIDGIVWKEVTGNDETVEITETGLPSGTYYIWTKDAEGNVTNVGKSAATGEVTDITDSNVTWQTTWNGSTATVSFNNLTDYDIEVSTNADFSNKLNIVNNSVTVPSGTAIYVRLTDGTNNSVSYRSDTPVRPGTVTYKMNDGTQNSFKVQNASDGDNVDVWFETKPNRANYEFVGWATSSEATSAVYTDTEDGTKTFTMGTEDVILYAYWKEDIQFALDKSNMTLSLNYQKTGKLTAMLNESQDVEWSSSDIAIATVDSNGNVTAKSEGSAVITAKAHGKTASCTVKVIKDVCAFTAGYINSMWSTSSSISVLQSSLKYLIDGNYGKQGDYGSLLMSSNCNNLYFTLFENCNILFSSNYYSDGGGTSGKKAYFYSENNGKYDTLYYTLTQLNYTTKYGKKYFPKGNYKIVVNERYVEFDEWDFEIVD